MGCPSSSLSRSHCFDCFSGSGLPSSGELRIRILLLSWQYTVGDPFSLTASALAVRRTFGAHIVDRPSLLPHQEFPRTDPPFSSNSTASSCNSTKSFHPSGILTCHVSKRTRCIKLRTAKGSIQRMCLLPRHDDDDEISCCPRQEHIKNIDS